MSKHRTRILVAGFVVFGVACGTASNPEMGAVGGVAGSDHGSATTTAGSGGNATANTGAGGDGESGNAGMGTTGGSGGSGEMASDSGSVGPSLDSGSDSGPGLILTGKKFVGNISTRGRISTDFNKYWNQFTPENEGKWGQAESRQGTFNWAPLDAEYQYAQQNNILFKHHNFIWGSQQPGWVAGLSAANAVSAVQTWMQGVCQSLSERQADRRRQRAASPHDAAVHEPDWWHWRERLRLDRQRVQVGARGLSEGDSAPQ